MPSAQAKISAFELAADGQVRRLAEEVLRVVDLALVVARQLAEVERRDAEHLAGPFAVAGRDDRRVDVEEALLLEEVVDRLADAVAHAGDGAERVGPRPQVGDRRAGTRSVCPFFCSGYVSGSASPMHGRRSSACTSVACPLAGDAFTSPSTVTLAAGVQVLDLRSRSWAASPSATTWTLPRQEPSLSSRKLKPPLESRRVRTQPWSRTCLPTASALRASATVIVSTSDSPFPCSESLWHQRIAKARERERRGLTGARPGPTLRREFADEWSCRVTDVEPAIEAIRRRQRWAILVGAFLAWMFAGLEISLFVLIHRQMIHGLLGADTPEAVVTKWFAWFQVAFLLGAAAGGWLFGIVGDIARPRAIGMARRRGVLFALHSRLLLRARRSK